MTSTPRSTRAAPGVGPTGRSPPAVCTRTVVVGMLHAPRAVALAATTSADAPTTSVAARRYRRRWQVDPSPPTNRLNTDRRDDERHRERRSLAAVGGRVVHVYRVGRHELV